MNLEYIDNNRSMEIEEIMCGISDHLKDATQFVNPQNIVGIFLQGSQNYRLDTQFSDIDTKLVIVPAFEDICFNKQPHSTTHIRANDEHIDEKDIRLYFNCFRKQNINFVEILFTNYFILMPKYEAEWKKLIENREMIARYDEYAAVSCMKGMAMEKLYALEHPYPNKIATLEKYGYDPKQLHHILRLADFIDDYLSGRQYEECLITKRHDYLIDVKNGCYSKEQAEELAKINCDYVCKKANEFRNNMEQKQNKDVDELLNEVQRNIIRIALKEELNV